MPTTRERKALGRGSVVAQRTFHEHTRSCAVTSQPMTGQGSFSYYGVGGVAQLLEEAKHCVIIKEENIPDEELLVWTEEEIIGIAKSIASDFVGPLLDAMTLVQQSIEMSGHLIEGKPTKSFPHGVKQVFKFNTFYTKKIGEKTYVIMRGRPGVRAALNGTRYLATNTQIVKLSIGPAAIAKGARISGLLTIVAVSVVDITEHLLADDGRPLTDLGINLFSNNTKAATSAVAGALASYGISSALAAAGFASIGLPIVGGIVVGLLVSYALNEIDEEYEITKSMKIAVAESVREAKRTFKWYDSYPGIFELMRYLRIQ